MERLALCAAMFALLSSGVSAVADDGVFGAVALDPKSGFVAFADAAMTRAAALAEVSAECSAHGADCSESHAFQNACASLARSSDDKAYGISVHDTRAASQEGAVKACADNGGSGCNIHDTYCSPEGLDQ